MRKLFSLIFLMLFIVFSVFYFIILLDYKETLYISLKNDLNGIYLCVSFNLIYLIFYRFTNIINTKAILLLPVNYLILSFVSITQEILRFRIFIYGLFSFFCAVYYSNADNQVVFLFIFYASLLLFVTTAFLTRTSLSANNFSVFNYSSFALINAFFLFNENYNSYLIIIASVILTGYNIYRIKISLKKIILNPQKQSRITYIISKIVAGNNNSLLSKEIKLLLRQKKGFGLIVHVFIISIICFLFIYLFGKSIKNDLPLILIFTQISSGLALGEYIQFCFSWDINNLNVFRLLPLNQQMIVMSKLNVIRSFLVVYSLLCFSFLMFYYDTILLLFCFAFNAIFLPHIYIMLAYHSHQKIHIDKSMHNVSTYTRPIKMIIIGNIVGLAEYILCKLNPSPVWWIVVLAGLCVILILIFEKTIISFHSKSYSNWIKKVGNTIYE